MSLETIALASDHAGFNLKMLLKLELENTGHKVLDLGTHSKDSVDYPDFAFALGQALCNKKAGTGVLICGTGIGISIAANRHPSIRAALVHDSLGARLSRLHNNANVICFGERMIGEEVAKDCLAAFLQTDFEGGRHSRRVDKLNQFNYNHKS